MIWFFLMGMIAGAVGMLMFIVWYVEGHTRIIRVRKDEIVKVEEKSDD